ncbi:MAG: hypothetical protein ACTSQS_19180, partial [Promethearchaeota archaeon]
ILLYFHYISNQERGQWGRSTNISMVFKILYKLGLENLKEITALYIFNFYIFNRFNVLKKKTPALSNING